MFLDGRGGGGDKGSTARARMEVDGSCFMHDGALIWSDLFADAGAMINRARRVEWTQETRERLIDVVERGGCRRHQSERNDA